MTGDKEMFSVRLPPDTIDQLEDLAEERGIRKSDAARKVIESGLNVERSDRFNISVDAPDPEPRTDGGQIQEQLNDIQRQERRTSLLLIWLGIALVWIGGEAFVGFPAWFSIPTGLLIITGLLYNWTKEYIFNRGDSNE